jgi:hypothetical protein
VPNKRKVTILVQDAEKSLKGVRHEILVFLVLLLDPTVCHAEENMET